MSEEDSELEEGSSLDAVLGASTIGDNGRGRPESGRADRKEREKISAFVQSEEIFNLIAHQRHLREEQRQITIREMRKQGLMNKSIRRAYEQAQIDLSQTEDHERMTQINRAIFMGDRSLQEIKNLGLDKRRRLFEDMEASTTDILVNGDGKPISLSVHKEQEAAEARRKDRIARGYLLEREKHKLRDKGGGGQDSDTPDLRWKWAFEFGAGQKGVTQSSVQRDMLRLTKATRDHRFELHRFDNRMRANVGTLSGRVLGENWWARQLLDHRDPMHLEMWAKLHTRPPRSPPTD